MVMKAVRVLILLFLPFILNMVINQILWFQVPQDLWSENLREAQIEFTSLLQTYCSPLMSLYRLYSGYTQLEL